MALKKRSVSAKVKSAIKRMEAMHTIDIRYGKPVNYGWDLNPLTLIEFKSQVAECKTLLDEYNNSLIKADKKSQELKMAEEKLGEHYTRVLAGAKSIFGVDSEEVAELGGTKRSERKRKK